MIVRSLKTSLGKICQLELFIADKYTPYLRQPSRALRSRTKQHNRAVNELSHHSENSQDFDLNDVKFPAVTKIVFFLQAYRSIRELNKSVTYSDVRCLLFQNV